MRPDPAFALLGVYDEALPQVFGYLLARCGDRALAEDLTAESFLAAVGAVRARPDAPVCVGWLVGIARHKLVDHWRRREREERGLRLLAEVTPESDDPWDAELDAMTAHEVLRGLAPQHRAALVLRYLDGLPVAEVALHLGRTLHATEALLVRARAAFRRAYPGEERAR